MHFLAIVVLCVLAAVTYGILHDQVTARICVEYFTIGHVPIFGTDDPTRLGLGWGVLATWWVGVMLGVPLAMVARIGKRPKRTAGSLIKPLVVLMAVSAVCAVVAGVTGAWLGSAGTVVLPSPLFDEVPKPQHVAFIADLFAHNASYLAGFVGGGIVIAWVWVGRVREAGKPE